ncbi:carboxypeptidase-like regulatory domain-containing protein [Flavobacterium antarcticum]|uniref:carboxypeptidase-like regulatory domain-containing protein n=1 Tax=Flavobacterium antarcticum TaxID=271155 RepID=UPI0012FA2267|nr:carboxypeptidase-like regulatory domain-containing protein [Flavobacterium antarcticum]
MTKKIIITIFILLSIISLSSCTSNDKEESGVTGSVVDESGIPLNDVSISYRNSLITVKTDAVGAFVINQPRTLFIKFEKEGYQTLSAKIDNFSEDAFYDFKRITLNKTSNSSANYNDVSLNTDPKFIDLKLYGTVLNSFGQPLKDVSVTLKDSTIESYSMNDEGNFNFKIFDNQISIEKEGFRKVAIQLPYYEKDKQNITLVKNSNKSGIYILKEDKYIPLPKTKLTYKSEEKIGSVLWGGNFAYNITDFYYPKNTKDFKIESDSIIRFIIFEPSFASGLFEAQNVEGYLCTANYKLTTTPFPSSKTESLPITEIYPPRFSPNSIDEPKIIEFKPSDRNKNYVFVNSTTKTGYYFTY